MTAQQLVELSSPWEQGGGSWILYTLLYLVLSAAQILLYMYDVYFTAERAMLELDCQTALNKATGQATIHAHWYIDGLAVDRATIDHYNIIVDWVTIGRNNVPMTEKVLRRVYDVQVSPVSDL